MTHHKGGGVDDDVLQLHLNTVVPAAVTAPALACRLAAAATTLATAAASRLLQ